MSNTQENKYQCIEQIAGLVSDGYDDEICPEENDEFATYFGENDELNAYLEEYANHLEEYNELLKGILDIMTNQLDESTD